LALYRSDLSFYGETVWVFEKYAVEIFLWSSFL
jgi:hypothetical protein